VTVVSSRFPEDFPTLETDRTTLQELTVEHAEGVFRNFSDAEMMRYLMTPITSIEQATQFVEAFAEEFKDGAGLTWAIVEKSTGVFLGTLSYVVDADGNGDIGFDIWKDYWGQGLMIEALQAVLDWGFNELGGQRTEAHTLVGNTRAIRVLEHAGFQVNQVRQDNTVVHGEPEDEIFFTIRSPNP